MFPNKLNGASQNREVFKCYLLAMLSLIFNVAQYLIADASEK
jgi:hypothetical protein